MAGNIESWLQLHLPFRVTPIFASFLEKCLGLAWLSALSAPGLVLLPVSQGTQKAPSTWGRDVGLRMVWSLVPMNVQTWGIP